MNLTEPAMLCLENWRALTQANPDWQARSSLVRSVYRDSEAFAFVRNIFEYVALPHDAFTAALKLHELSRETPEAMPRHLKLALRVGGIASVGLPWGVIPAVKQRFRAHLSELITTTEHLPRPHQLGGTTDLELLGDPTLGTDGARRELERLTTLVNTDGVARITLQVHRLIPHLHDWALDEAAHEFAHLTQGLFRDAAAAEVTITLRGDTYGQILALPTFVATLLDTLIAAPPALGKISLGVEIPAELPEAHDLIEQLRHHATADHRLEVRLTNRSITGPETILAAERGLAVPTLTEQTERDSQWISLLSTLMHPRSVDHLSVIIASEDPVILALAQVIWQRNEHASPLRVLCTMGRAPALAEALQATGIEVFQLVPTVPTAEFSSASPSVLETLTDVVTPGSWFEQVDTLTNDSGRASLQMFRERLNRATQTSAGETERFTSHRHQDRMREWEPETDDTPAMYRPPTQAHQFETGGLTAQVLRLTVDDAQEQVRATLGEPLIIPIVSSSGFVCEPDTDAAQLRNREWMRRLLTHATTSIDGKEAAETSRRGPWALDEVLKQARLAGEEWNTYSHQQRATLVRRVALALSAARDRLVSVIAAERGLPVHEIDHEIGYAIDAARYLSARADGLRAIRGATFHPYQVTLLLADETTSPGALAEALTAVIASGSGAVLCVAPTLARIAAVLAEEFALAGVPEHTITLVVPPHSPEGTVGRIIDSGVCDAVRGYADEQTASLVRKIAPSLPREIRTPRVGSAVVTPSADPYQAADDVAHSLLWGGGSHHQNLHAVITVSGGSAGDVFTRALVDELSAVQVGHSADGTAAVMSRTLGPLPAPPNPGQLRALTELEPGESWLLQPVRLDEEGRLWSPGVRTGVRHDSRFWNEAVGLPIIGVVHTRSLHEALHTQNTIGAGGVAAMFSLDAGDIIPFLERAESAYTVVNTRTTGARVERQPTGVWGGGGAPRLTLAGGPNRFIPYGVWELRAGTQSDTLHLRGLDPLVRSLIETAQSHLNYIEFDRVRRAALADTLAWRTHFGVLHDSAGLPAEHNLIRYRRVPVHVRLAEGAPLVELLRVIAAGLLTGAPLSVSVPVELPAALNDFLSKRGVPVTQESDETWIERASRSGANVAGEGESPADRIRLIGGDAVRTVEWMSSHPQLPVLTEPVTMAGPVELLSFMREQHLTINCSRHGLLTPIEGVEEWLQSL